MERAPYPPLSQAHTLTPSTHPAPVPTSNPADERATAQTIERMTRLVIIGSTQPTIQAAAELATIGQVSKEDKARAIHSWVRKRIRYTADEETAALNGLDPEEEVLIAPAELLELDDPAGDCDDFSMLTAAMLMAAGVPAAFKTIAADTENPEQYSHVYVLAETEAGPLALDTSHGPRPGWEAPAVGRSRVWRIPTMNHTAQLGAVSPWVQDLIKIGAEAGASITKARYGQPPAGTYQQGADGSVLYRQDPNANPLTFPGASLSGSTSTLFIVAGVAALLLVLTMGGHRR